MNKNNKREEILDAASRCIAQKGYASVSLRDIAAEAGVALSQLHYYFGNKETIFREIISNFTDEFSTGFDSYLRTEQLAENKIELLVKYLKKISAEEVGSCRILCDLFSLSLWSESFKKIFNDLFYKLTQIIEEHIINNNKLKENYIKYSKATLASVLVNTIFGIMMQSSVANACNNGLITSLGVMGEIFK